MPNWGLHKFYKWVWPWPWTFKCIDWLMDWPIDWSVVLSCTAGVQVPQYEEEFRQLFLLTLDKLKQVGIIRFSSVAIACLLFVVPSHWLHSKPETCQCENCMPYGVGFVSFIFLFGWLGWWYVCMLHCESHSLLAFITPHFHMHLWSFMTYVII